MNIKADFKAGTSLRPVPCPYGSVLALNDLPGQSQSDSDTSFSRILSSVKPFEKMRNILLFKSLPLIPDQNFGV